MRNTARSFWIVAFAVVFSLRAPAAAIVVTSPADSGPGSLRQAVADARRGDVITFSAGVARIELGGTEIVVDKDLEIRGPSAQSPGDQLVIDANGASRVFRVTGPQGGVLPKVLLSDLALTGGAVSGGNGGAILNEGALTLLRCSVYGNAAAPGPGGGGNGGGVSNAGTLDIEASTIYDNKAVVGALGSGNGGGIYNGWAGRAAVVPELTLFNSTVSGNEAGALSVQGPAGMRPLGYLMAVEEKIGMGGGIFADTEPAGGAWGVDAFPGWIDVEHSTITANRAWTGGGVTNYLFSENGESTIGEVAGGAVLLRGSILSGNIAVSQDGVPDIQGDALPFGSVIGSHLGNLGGHGNIESQDPGLMPLADNGGPTLTHAPKPGSPAVNAGPPDTDHLTDQTGAPRVVAGRIDSGSVENPAPPMPLGGGASAAYRDRDGDSVSILLAGPGRGYATVEDGADAVDIVLEGTAEATELQISTGGQTTVRTIDVTGDLKGIQAPNVDLLGSITVTGGVKTLVLRDVIGFSEITLGAAPGHGARLQFRNVADLALTTSGKVKELTAAKWDGEADGAHDALRAARIGKVAIAGWATQAEDRVGGRHRQGRGRRLPAVLRLCGRVPGARRPGRPPDRFRGECQDHGVRGHGRRVGRGGKPVHRRVAIGEGHRDGQAGLGGQQRAGPGARPLGGLHPSSALPLRGTGLQSKKPADRRRLPQERHLLRLPRFHRSPGVHFRGAGRHAERPHPPRHRHRPPRAHVPARG